jgi:hypothetical protein
MIKFIAEEKAWLLSHLVWVVAVAVALVIGHIALQEHDQRVVAEAAIKVSELKVSDLQAQIKAADAAAATQVQAVTKVVHDLGSSPTVGQVVAAIPQLTNVPLNARVAVDNPAQVSVNAVPFVNFLAAAKIDQINLGACQADLKNETAISTEKDTQIAVLKKKPKFLTRVKHIAEAVGVGITIGLLIK